MSNKTDGARRFGVVALAAAGALGLAGCVSLAQRVAQDMVDRSIRHDHVIQVIEGDAARYRECLKSRGGSCPSGPGALEHAGFMAVPSEATAALSDVAMRRLREEDPPNPGHLAASALDCQTLGDATKLYSYLRGLPTSPSQEVRMERSEAGTGSTVKMSVSIAGVQHCQDMISRATAAGGWDALESSLRGYLERDDPASREHRDLTADHRRAAFVKEYVKAYFSNGHILSIDLQVDEATAIEKLTRDLARHSELCQAYNAAEGSGSGAGPECAELAAKIYRGVLGSTLGSGKPLYLLKAKAVGYLPRDGGAKLQFPEIDVDFDPVQRPLLAVTYSDGSAGADRFGSAFWLPVGLDLVRVVLEAVFDAHEGLPAVSGATGLAVPGYPLAAVANLGDDNVVQNLDKMRQVNQGTAAGVGVVLDRLIRGIGPFSLNNEAVEQLIVAVVTTSVQKAVEKATWCFYSCGLNLAIERAEEELKEKAKADERRLSGDLRNYAYDKTEEVQLHLSLSD